MEEIGRNRTEPGGITEFGGNEERRRLGTLYTRHLVCYIFNLCVEDGQELRSRQFLAQILTKFACFLQKPDRFIKSSAD